MERSGLSTIDLRICIRLWNEIDLVPLACEDAYAYGTKWACEDAYAYGTKWTQYPLLSKIHTHMERSELSTLGLRRCIRTWNEVDLIPLACEDAYAYGTKWAFEDAYAYGTKRT